MNKFWKLLLTFGPWIAWMSITYYLSDLPAEKVLISHTDWVEQNLKNCLHFIQYFGLAILSLRVMWKMKIHKPYAMAFVWCALFAASDEIHQLSTPGRQSSWSDWVIDLSGAMAALIVINYLRRIPLLRKILFLE